MRAIPRPQFTVEEVMNACRGNVSNQAFHDRLGSIVGDLSGAEADYEQRGPVAQLYQIAGTVGVAGQVSTEEMIWVYNTKLSRKGQPGRPYYDAIKGSAPRGICPLCAQRVVSTLDHYLAKTTHPFFAVTPINLVPACSDCNKAKLAHNPAIPQDQTFHPYFEHGDDGLWLYARVIEGVPPAVSFYTQPPANWGDVKRLRIQKHFTTFGLGALYGSNAAQELSQISYVLKRIGDTVGSEGVRQHLSEQAASRREPALNSWQTALYTALASCVWFYTEGYRHIE